MGIFDVKLELLANGWFNMGYLVFSTAYVWSGVNLSMLLIPGLTPLVEPISISQISWLSYIFILGLLCGMLYFITYLIMIFYLVVWRLWLAPLPNRYGRKMCMILGSSLVVIAWCLLVWCHSYAVLMIARYTVGFGVSGMGIAQIMYVSETSSSHIRGRSLTLSMTLFSLGTVVFYCIFPIMTYRGACYLGLAITILYLCPLYWIPESPVYLLTKGRRGEAKMSVMRLRRCSEEQAESVLDDMEDTIRINNKERIDKLDQGYTVKSKSKAIIITTSLWSLSIVIFGTGIIETLTMIKVGGSQYMSVIILSIIKLISATASLLLVDRLGRKPLLIISSSVCGCCLVLFGVYYFYLSDDAIAVTLSWVPLTSNVLFFLFNGLGMNVIPLILIGELLDVNMKALGSAVVRSVGYFISLFIYIIYDHLINAAGYHGFFWFLSAGCFAIAIFTALFIPETKCKSLKEVQETLNK